MRPSRFNVFFTHEGFTIGFNTFSKDYIILEDILYKMYITSAKTGNFYKLRKIHSDFYHTLVEKNFIVEDNLDEIAPVKEISSQIDNDDTKFELHINPTMNCNFKCWYCYETHIKDSKMERATIEHTQKYIERIFEEKKSLREFHLGWFGGEPLLYFHEVMLPILRSTYEIARSNSVDFSSSLTSNGLLLTPEVIDQVKRYNLEFFQITLDGNREKHNKVRFISKQRGSYDKIVSNIFQVAKNQLTALVRINVAVETLDGLLDIADDFSALNSEERKFVRFDLHKVWQVKEDIDSRIQEMRVFFRSKGFKVVSGTFDCVIDSCYGDHRNHATLNYNGDVFKCTARDFKTDSREGILNDNGSIQWGDKYYKRLSSKFKNKPCLECAVLPMCGGGCTQQAIEHEGLNYCVFEFNEDKKIAAIKNKFLEILDEA